MLGLALLLGGCASNPTGGMDFVLMSKDSELRIGKEEHEKLMQAAQVYQDEKLTAYVEQVGQRLAAISHAPELEYHFTVIDSPDINAFALPGGYVYINRGLLTLLSSEDQLAAVLGHEIGHITARHAVRQQTAGRTARIVSTAATVASVVTTGTSVLGDTANLFGGALVSGYGREMELEADGLGAQYLRKAGYDANAMVQVIEVLKNHEDFMKKTSNRAPAYHGLFASHPRNDTRLQQAVAQAADVSALGTVNVDPALFREKTSGLVVGPSLQNMTGALGRNRYYQTLLGYTMVFPEDWALEETPTTVTATAPEQAATLKVEVLRLQEAIEPRLFIRERLGIADLRQTETLAQFGLGGFTGLDPQSGERLAVIYYGPRAYVFTGAGQGNGFDDAQLNAIRSFRPIARNEGIFANPIQISWIQAEGQVRYADLARRSRIPGFPEEMLRLMNSDYPAGEPQAGEWVKITN
ncbi:MAG TPA: M48 family metalloprotease [Hyphomicrobiales bacterium]|nr:M48 family metalloprotease [Hyphomicrobiales bacterium]